MILEMLQSGEKCACVLLEKLEISQPTLSHHMKILVDSGIVAARKEGRWTYYAISEAGSENAAKLLRELTAVTIDETNKDNARCYEWSKIIVAARPASVSVNRFYKPFQPLLRSKTVLGHGNPDGE